jgi:hypothetical protein
VWCYILAHRSFRPVSSFMFFLKFIRNGAAPGPLYKPGPGRLVQSARVRGVEPLSGRSISRAQSGSCRVRGCEGWSRSRAALKAGPTAARAECEGGSRSQAALKAGPRAARAECEGRGVEPLSGRSISRAQGARAECEGGAAPGPL